MERVLDRLAWIASTLLLVVSLGLFLDLGMLACAQSPALPCESQVQEQYQKLVDEQFLSLPPGGVALTPPQKVMEISGQLRVLTRQYQAKVQQALLAERNVAVLQEQYQLLLGEFERLKNGATAGAPAAPPKAAGD
jgi:hypothetical protein